MTTRVLRILFATALGGLVGAVVAIFIFIPHEVCGAVNGSPASARGSAPEFYGALQVIAEQDPGWFALHGVGASRADFCRDHPRRVHLPVFAGSAPTVRVAGKVVAARAIFEGRQLRYSTDRPAGPTPQYVELFIDQGNGNPIAVHCPDRLSAWCWRLTPGSPIAANAIILGTAGEDWSGDYADLGTVTVLDGVRMWRTKPALEKEDE